MRPLTKNVSFYGLLLIALSAAGVWLYRDWTTAIEINAGVFSNALGMDRVVGRKLSDALKKNPRAKRFKLRWIVLGNSKGPLRCEIDYHRPSNQLSELSLYSGFDNKHIFANVTDDAIHKVAREGRPMYRLRAHGASLGYQTFLSRLQVTLRRWFGW